MSPKATKIKQIVIIASFFAALVGLLLANLLTPDQAVSESERRKLAQKPEYTAEKLWSGKYFSEFEDYALDQFVSRDTFRAANAFLRYDLMMTRDNNNIVVKGNDIYKMEYPTSEPAILKAAEVYNKVYDMYYKDTDAKVYYCIVPDKNYYGLAGGSYLTLDYDKVYGLMREQVKGMTEIDIRDQLSADDYYHTDLHWRQTDILPAANKILTSMGREGNLSLDQFTAVSLEGFKGSYYGQAALPLPKDTLIYLTNAELENCKILNHETYKKMPMYDEKDFANVDSYDLYLGGPKALLQITNPANNSGKQLVVYRDSFGSSLVPLLVPYYSEIIVVDLRYVMSEYVGQLVKMQEDCDVLFMYNSLMLNQYGIIK